MRPALALLLLPLALASARAGEPPARLQDTGLGGPGVVAFEPRFPLWTDGAAKHRWLKLPEGATIDASNPDAWQFPPGTTLWKEFAFGGRPVETRMIRREADGRWTYAAYVWNAAGTEATLAPARGLALAVAGQRHTIPSRDDCRACHEAAPVPVLGYSALQLGRTPVEPALGHLHGNCAHCHHPQGVPVRLNLQQRVADAEAARHAVRATLVDAPSRWQATAGTVLPMVAPGDPERSVLWQRMASRDPRRQMPPLGTHIPDPEGLALVAAWIRQTLNEENP